MKKRRFNISAIENVRKAQSEVIRLLRRKGSARWRDLKNIARKHRLHVYWCSKAMRKAKLIRRTGVRGIYVLT